jgi:hypothetical protein
VSDGRVLRWTARRLPGIDGRLRADLVASVDQLAGRGGRQDRALETASLVGFALRSASRRGAGDDRRELVRQGVRTGALVLAVLGAVGAWSAVATATTPAALVLAVLATLAAAAIAGGLRTTAVAVAAASAVAGVVAGTGIALPLVVLGAVALGHRFDARTCPVGAGLAVAGIAAGATVAALAPGATPAGLVVAGVAVPLVLLGVGWFDPRYAVAATVVWAWRLVAVDVGELAGAVQALGDEAALRLLLARWLLMALGVVAAWRVSRAAIRRCLAA